MELIAMREQLVRDREDWKEEKRGEARRKERGTGPHSSQYTARVANVPRQYDPVQACKETAIEINGVKILNPAQCEDRGCSGVIGHWMVPDPSCVTHFDGFADKGCTGPGSGRRLIESRLWNLQGGDDWRDMCSTTPAGFPRNCPSVRKNELIIRVQGIRGVWGTWNIEDRECFLGLSHRSEQGYLM
ncbi:hypothetical protein B0H14DRAFT_2990811 [Mycena olivaceomarginata]|nr:hypothetical protein B0H14DRAFT_2990811 [Mycena olivaceomarginata]